MLMRDASLVTGLRRAYGRQASAATAKGRFRLNGFGRGTPCALLRPTRTLAPLRLGCDEERWPAPGRNDNAQVADIELKRCGRQGSLHRVTVSADHYFSLRTTANKIGALAVVAVGGCGFFGTPPTLEFLFSAIVLGIVLGTAGSWHWLDTRWPRFLAIFLVLLLATIERDRLNPRLDLEGKFLVSIQFIAVAFVVVYLLVTIVDEVRRRRVSS